METLLEFEKHIFNKVNTSGFLESVLSPFQKYPKHLMPAPLL